MRKTVTTTRDYDDEGRLTREVVTEVSEDNTPRCTCSGASMYSGYCMVHGYRQYGWPPGTITCGGSNSGMILVN